MAKIPMYQQQVGLQAGGGPSKQGRIDVSSGNKALAQGVSAASERFLRVEEQKANLVAENMKLEKESEWLQVERQQQESISSAPAKDRLKLLNDYVKSAENAYDDGINQAMDGLSPMEQRVLRQKLQRVKYAGIERAVMFEASQKGEAQKEIFIDNNQYYQNKVYLDANEYDAQKEAIEAGIDELNIDASAKRAIKDEQMEKLAIARTQGRIYAKEYNAAKEFLTSEEAKISMDHQTRHSLLMSVERAQKVSNAADYNAFKREIAGHEAQLKSGVITEIDPTIMAKAVALDMESGHDEFSRRLELAAEYSDDSQVAVSGSIEDIEARLNEISGPEAAIVGTAQTSRLRHYQEVVSRARAEEARDPAAYALKHSESVTNTYAQLQELINNPEADPAAVAAKSQEYVEESLAYQQSRGLRPSDQRIVPEPDRLKLQAQLADAQGDYTQLMSVVANMKMQYGDHFFRAYSEMGGDMNETVLGAFTSNNPFAVEALVANSQAKAVDLVPEQSERSSLEDDARTAFADVRETMIRTPGGAARSAQYESLHERLTLIYHRSGVKNPAETAREHLFGDYEYVGAARIPKEHGGVVLDTDNIKRGMEEFTGGAALVNMGFDPIIGMDADTYGEQGQYEALVNLAGNAYYMIAPDESGLVLYYDGATGPTPFTLGGEPAVVPWEKLATEGAQRTHRTSEGSGRTPNYRQSKYREMYSLNRQKAMGAQQ